MEIRERASGAASVLDVTGRMVLTESGTDWLLKNTVIDLLARDRRQFVVNLAGVSQVDTSGLTSLVAARLAVVKRGGRLALAHPTPRIRDLLAITRLNVLFEMFETEEDAIAHLARQSGV